MRFLAVQYLEPGPHIATITPADARERLRAAFSRLPITHVLLGWNLPEALVAACRQETEKAGASLYLWHPLLTGDGVFQPQPGWQTIGLNGAAAPGFRNMPEFTFVCPNRPAVRQAALDHLGQIVRCGGYEGLFLDRIRYPSSAADPGRWLSCFCEDCQRKAAAGGLDLEGVRQTIRYMVRTLAGGQSFLQTLLGSLIADPESTIIHEFLEFRERSISELVGAAAELIHGAGMAVGLDCFAPSLARLVGQNLEALDALGQWTKVMVYGHTFGPAGLPYELIDLAQWLVDRYRLDETAALPILSQTTGLPLPPSIEGLKVHGLAPAALQLEMRRARSAGVRNLLAGIELVKMAAVTNLNEAQITADLRALKVAEGDGLALSWDLWHMPLEWLGLVQELLAGDR